MRAAATQAGYSGTPLPKKIGIKAGHRLAFLNAPKDFRALLGELPADTVVLPAPRKPLDVAVLFATKLSELKKHFAKVAAQLTPAGMLWVAWPKKASGVATDLSEGAVREFGLAAGLVDVKICAIDQTWSGLKFVIRLKDRR